MRRGQISKNIIAFLILVSVSFYIRGGQATAQPPIQPPGLDIAIQAQEAHTPELLGNPEVVGTAVGLDDEGKPVIQVFTKSARFRDIPNDIEGFPIEVIITGPLVLSKGPPSGGGSSGGGGGGGGGDKCDKDGDLVPGNNGKRCNGPDCDDSDPTVHPAYNNPNVGFVPAAIEYCDGKDNDCDGLVDEGCCATDADCSDANVCTADSCDIATGVCSNTPIPGCCAIDADCSDANVCTADSCDIATGVCSNTPIPGCGSTECPPSAPATSASQCNVDGQDENRCQRPIPIGVSIGNEWLWCGAGTYGFRGIRDGQVLGVGNYHVLAINLNGATISLGDAIMQPGLYDLWSCIDYNPNDRVGGLAGVAPIKFCSCGDSNCLNNPANANVVDAAIFDPSVYNPNLLPRLDNATLSDGYGTPKSNTIPPAIGMNVQKYGRTTGQTTGQISGINGVFSPVQYPNGKCATFVDQIVITPAAFSDSGDSGALIVVDGGCDDRRPVALLWASSVDDITGQVTATIANPIDAVLAAFPGLTVDGE